jgi:hypothetical protein
MGNEPAKNSKPQESASDKMFDMIFEFKMMAKEFEKIARKSQNEENQVKLKVKQAIEKNDMKAAQMYAADAIRKRNESKKYQTLSFKIDAVHSRLKNAYQTQKVIINIFSQSYINKYEYFYMRFVDFFDKD